MVGLSGNGERRMTLGVNGSEKHLSNSSTMTCGSWRMKGSVVDSGVLGSWCSKEEGWKGQNYSATLDHDWRMVTATESET